MTSQCVWLFFLGQLPKIISDGLDDFSVTIDEETGDRWIFAGAKKENNALEVWNVDEYGDRSYMWDYR